MQDLAMICKRKIVAKAGKRLEMIRNANACRGGQLVIMLIFARGNTEKNYSILSKGLVRTKAMHTSNSDMPHGHIRRKTCRLTEGVHKNMQKENECRITYMYMGEFLHWTLRGAVPDICV